MWIEWNVKKVMRLTYISSGTLLLRLLENDSHFHLSLELNVLKIYLAPKGNLYLIWNHLERSPNINEGTHNIYENDKTVREREREKERKKERDRNEEESIRDKPLELQSHSPVHLQLLPPYIQQTLWDIKLWNQDIKIKANLTVNTHAV